MARKDFKGAAAQGVDRLFSANDATNSINSTNTNDSSEPLTPDEQTQTTRRQPKTGKYTRFSISLLPDQIQYVHVMSGILGCSLSAFIEQMVTKDMERNAAAYEQAKEIAKNVRG